MNNRYTIRRAGSKPSPYVAYALRCKYAVECFEAITASEADQVIMLELAYGVGAC